MKKWLVLLMCLIIVGCAQTKKAKKGSLEGGRTIAKSHYEKGIAYLKEDFIIDAEREFEKAIKENPEDINAHWQLAWLYKKQGYIYAATEKFEKVIELNPRIVEAHYQLGTYYLSIGETAQSIKEYEKVLEIEPNHKKAKDIHSILATFYCSQDKYSKAAHHYKKILQLDPSNKDAKKMLSKIEAHKKRAEIDERPEGYCTRGFIYLKYKQYSSASKEFQKAIKLKPDYAYAHFGLGMAHLHKDLHNKAIVELKEASKLDPTLAEMAHLLLGVIYIDTGEYDKATEESQKALKINPNSAKAHINLGTIYGFKGMYDKAISEYKEAIKIDPTLTKAYVSLGKLYAKKGMHDEAIATLKIAEPQDKSLDVKTPRRVKKQTYKGLTLSQQKEIYLYVTDVPAGPQADRRIAQTARKYNISKGDVLQILSLGTFEYGWGRLP